MSNVANAPRTRARLRRLALPSAIALSMLLAEGSAAAANRVLTIYFCGTSSTSEWNRPEVSGWHTPELIATLYANDPSQEITKTTHLAWGSNVVDSVDTLPGKEHYRYVVDGFGTPSNLLEVVDPNAGPRTWNVVMNEAFMAINRVLDLNPDDTVSLNLVGWSRGGVMAMKTARGVVSTPAIDAKVIGINILAFDPVPGCQDPIGVFGNDFILPPKVNQFVGLYAFHEMSSPFEPVIPSRESNSTRMWTVVVPGGHETMMGNFQFDGHNLVTEKVFLDYSYDPNMARIAEVTRAIAEQLLNSPAWGSLQLQPLSPANNESYFNASLNSIWDHDFTLVMNTTFVPLSWSLLRSCHDPGEMIRSPAGSLLRLYDVRLCFVSPNRHEPHWAWVWPCDIFVPIRYFQPDLVFWLPSAVPQIDARAWGTLQALGASVPPGMDDDPPVPMVSPLPDAIGECSITVTAPRANDASGPITATTADPRTYTEQGTHVITWTYTDASGNSTTQTQNVIVKDTMAPMITAPPAVTAATVPDAASCGVVIDETVLGTATAKDNCSEAVTITRSGVPSGNLFPVGMTTVTYTALDAAGNTSTAEQTVTVNDNTPPALVVSDLIVPTDATVCYAVVKYDVKATDNCGVTVVSTPPSGSKFAKGMTEVTVTATDASGNATTKAFKVMVVDREEPRITNAIATPAVLWPPNHKLLDVAVAYDVLDNCDQPVCALSVSSNEPINGTDDADTAPDWEIVGPHAVHLRAERAGTGAGRVYTIAVACTDSNGNTSNRTVAVTVPLNNR